MTESKPTVVIMEPIHEAGHEILRKSAQVIQLSGPLDADLEHALSVAEGLIVRSVPVTRELMSKSPRLRVIGRHGAGIDNIDLVAAKERGIAIVSTPLSNTESVAEHVIGTVFFLLKRFHDTSQALSEGQFTPAQGSLPGQVQRLGLTGVELAGKTLGLIGFGMIGRAVCRKASALGFSIIAYDPFVPDSVFHSENAQKASSLRSLLELSHVVSLHVPGQHGQPAILGAPELAIMRSDAYLINAARGGVVDELALSNSLHSGHLAGAAVDVYTSEPPDEGNPLFGAPRVLLTPHSAAMTNEALERMSRDVCANTLAAFAQNFSRA